MKKICYSIQGGNSVSGSIECLGAKNFVTKAMVACVLSDETSILTNVPNIGDVEITSQMLQQIGIGVSYSAEKKELIVAPASMNSSHIKMPHSGSNRVPILLLGSLLHKSQEVSVPAVGGCKIGERKVDFHLDAIRKFGGVVNEVSSGFEATTKGRLRGCKVRLNYPSVGATETLLFLGVLAEGVSILENVALEPEIDELIIMLQSMGAIIHRQPDRKIVIEGVDKLSGARMNILGDRIEAASWACLACACDGNLIINNIRVEVLGNFFSYFRKIGGGYRLLSPTSIEFFRENPLRPIMLETDVFPGFATDWQQPFAVLLTQANGVSIIHETVYENRFGYLEALKSVGAQVQLTEHCLGKTECRYQNSKNFHSAIITGPTAMMSDDTVIEVPDLRAGLSYLIVAILAEGKTVLRNSELIERGYGNLVERLQNTNLKISRYIDSGENH